MATLRGQNFRILTLDSQGNWSCIGMATSCTVTLNTNTEESATKDVVGMFAKPDVVAHSWQVQVESLSVADCGAILTAIKTNQKFYLKWDETSTTDNQTALEVLFSRGGYAYLSDVTFNFDNRTNATKSLQFVGVSELKSEYDMGDPTTVLPAGSYTKGQFVRLFLGLNNTSVPTTPIAAARNLSLHVSVSLEDSQTKDSVGDWAMQEPTSISFDISTSALMRSGETITSSVNALDVESLESLYSEGAPVKFQIANVSGDNNRTKGSVIVSGSVIITSLTLNGPQRGQVADYTAQLNGYGDYTVGS